mmetsp:Transcript_64860/g.115384  ORF Transcript_64860/g.115384 Transcript_64860/m.115384 type:complete len:253 (-) Transcript_64860:506-1264(-)
MERGEALARGTKQWGRFHARGGTGLQRRERVQRGRALDVISGGGLQWGATVAGRAPQCPQSRISWTTGGRVLAGRPASLGGRLLGFLLFGAPTEQTTEEALLFLLRAVNVITRGRLQRWTPIAGRASQCPQPGVHGPTGGGGSAPGGPLLGGGHLRFLIFGAAAEQPPEEALLLLLFGAVNVVAGGGLQRWATIASRATQRSQSGIHWASAGGRLTPSGGLPSLGGSLRLGLRLFLLAAEQPPEKARLRLAL